LAEASAHTSVSFPCHSPLMLSLRAMAAAGVASSLLGILLVGCGAQVELPAACTPSAATPSGNEVSVYFGCGCFWHVQHAFVTSEMADLCRQGDDISARTAYAGGTQTGPDGLVCYHNAMSKADYGALGHAEVVSLNVPESAFGAFAAKFWETCSGGVRRDTQDAGGEYRSVIGLPGGMNSPLLEQLQAGAGAAKLVSGQGNEDDTLGTGNVLVYDTKYFPAHTAEKFHQFHNDMVDNYGTAYNDLRSLAKATSCPGDVSSFLQ